MKKTILFAVSGIVMATMMGCMNTKTETITTDDFTVTIDKGSRGSYHPTYENGMVYFENGMQYIATRMLEENIDNGRDDIMLYPVGENVNVKKVAIRFAKEKAIYDYTGVVNALAREGWLKLDTTMVDSYMLTIVDSTKRDPGKSDWAGSYSIRKCCGIAAIDAEGFNYSEWAVPMKALREDIKVETLNEYLLTKGLALIPTGNKIEKITISAVK